MRKYILAIITLMASVFTMHAQQDFGPAFSKVPVVNGKVVFQQFIHTDKELTADQKYALLHKWGKDNYTGDPMLSGIRFNDKDQSITVSSKAEFSLPANSKGVREKMLMNYRFDVSITNGGCLLVVRDITYQNVQNNSGSFFPKTYSAEEMITDAAVSSASGETKELRSNTQKSTVTFLNKLVEKLNGIFELKK